MVRPLGALVLITTLAQPSCRDGGPDAAIPPSPSPRVATQAAPRASAPAPAPAPAVAPPNRRTTPGDVAVRNLTSQIDGFGRALATRPSAKLAARVVDLRLMRSQFVGTSSDLERAQAGTAELVRDFPDDPAAWTTRARALSAVHDFEGALAALDAAERAGADAGLLGRQRAGARAALGDAAAARELAAASRAAVEATPGYASQASLATALMQLGRYTEADAAFARAQAAYRDLSPFARAWIDFQRGVMWAERAGRPERALPLYEAAVRRLPQYHTAAVHLAELLVERGRVDEAIAALRVVADVAEDPEANGKLGDLLLESDDPAVREEGARRVSAARAAYERLLGTLEAAYADHAAEFFGSHDEPKRARALAEKNLALRKTPRAYDLAIRMTRDAGGVERACQLAALAGALEVRTPVLDATIEQVKASSCGGALPPLPRRAGAEPRETGG